MKSVVRSNWEGALLICRKCTKRQRGGFGKKGRTPLGKVLKRALKQKGGRKARIGLVEVKCLGICPRHAVTMVDTRNPGEWLLVKPGTQAETLVEQLGLAQPGEGVSPA